MLLLRNADLYSPQSLGLCDVLVAGAQVIAITPAGQTNISTDSIDLAGAMVMPGLVDALTHPCGGGGEGGFGNRTAEIPASVFARSGVLTPVAALGTDSLGRSLDVLYGNVMALRAAGLDAFMYTGAYRVPAPTLTGDVARDLYLVDPVVGVGEVAIADHRGAQPTAAELRRLAADAALGGILTGVGGTVMVHVGDGDSRLSLLHAALAHSDLRARNFYPTHINRSELLLGDAVAWAKLGGFVDITVSTTPELIAAGDIPADVAFRWLLDAGAPASQITFSSDAGGSLPLYIDGELQGLTAADPAVLLELLAQIRRAHSEHYELALAAMTTNPARALKLPGRGVITEGGIANLVVVDESNDPATPSRVMAQGKWLLDERQ